MHTCSTVPAVPVASARPSRENCCQRLGHAHSPGGTCSHTFLIHSLSNLITPSNLIRENLLKVLLLVSSPAPWPTSTPCCPTAPRPSPPKGPRPSSHLTQVSSLQPAGPAPQASSVTRLHSLCRHVQDAARRLLPALSWRSGSDGAPSWLAVSKAVVVMETLSETFGRTLLLPW